MGRSTRLISLPTFSKTTLLLMTLLSGQSYASGFQLFEYNSTDIGLTGAGGAAYAQDASTNFTNSAGLVNLKHPEFVMVGNIIDATGVFKGQACGGANALGAPSLTNPAGDTVCNYSSVNKDGGGVAFVPAFHYGMPVTDRVYAGLSLTAPFGLSTNYDHDTALRYSATKSEIKTVDISPDIAFKFTDQFSLGAGFSLQKMNATLNSDLSISPDATTVRTIPFTVTRQYGTSTVENQGDDWGWGWNVGGLYQFTPGSRLGVSYRSEVKHSLEGQSKRSATTATQVTPLGTTTSPFPGYEVDQTAKVDLPAVTTVSFYQELTSEWAVMASAYYTQWHSIQNVTLNDVALFSSTSTALVPPPQATPVTLPQHFDNTWRLSLGTEYKVTDDLTLRTGGSHDESPVNNTDRTVRLPDSDRWAWGLGAGYRINQYIKVDAGYEHVWFDEASINQTTPPNSLSSSIGKVDPSANIYSLEATVDII